MPRNSKYFDVQHVSKGTSVRIIPKRTIRVAIINDIHVPYHDPTAISLCLKVLEAVAPEILIINGDFVDFFAISRFDKNPHRKLMLGEEIQKARQVLDMFTSRLKPELWVFLMGNHEERMRMYLWTRAPELSVLDEIQLPNLLGLNKFKQCWIVLDYKDTPTYVGEDTVPTVHFPEFFVMHGDKIRMSGNTINLARSIFLKVLRNALVGHWHRADSYIQMDYYGKSRGCWVIPCLCLQRPHWDSGRIWGQGLGVTEVNPRGFFKVDIVSFIKDNGNLITFWNGREFSVKIKEGMRSEDLFAEGAD